MSELLNSGMDLEACYHINVKNVQIMEETLKNTPLTNIDVIATLTERLEYFKKLVEIYNTPDRWKEQREYYGWKEGRFENIKK